MKAQAKNSFLTNETMAVKHVFKTVFSLLVNKCTCWNAELRLMKAWIHKLLQYNRHLFQMRNVHTKTNPKSKHKRQRINTVHKQESNIE